MALALNMQQVIMLKMLEKDMYFPAMADISIKSENALARVMRNAGFSLNFEPVNTFLMEYNKR